MTRIKVQNTGITVQINHEQDYISPIYMTCSQIQDTSYSDSSVLKSSLEYAERQETPYNSNVSHNNLHDPLKDFRLYIKITISRNNIEYTVHIQDLKKTKS